VSTTKRARKKAPIWTQPAPGSRKPRFTREQIAEIALKIADAEGFEAVSMRRVADELGAGTMTLYYYVRTKEDLIALMDDAIMAEVIVPASKFPAGWRERVTVVAHWSMAAFQRHPWSLTSQRSNQFSLHSLRHFEQSLAAVADAPFDDETKLELLLTVDDYVFGYALRSDKDFSSEHDPVTFEYAHAQVQTGEFPHMAKLIDTSAPSRRAWESLGKRMNDVRRFERGLEALLDGFEARRAKRR
jgi:AcrR family transcriptional regulator